MKAILLPVLLLSVSFSACQKLQSDDKAKSIISSIEQSKVILESYIEQLESNHITAEAKRIIICKDYPREFKSNYLPNMLKLESSGHTQKSLLNDLNLTLSHYQCLVNIQC